MLRDDHAYPVSIAPANSVIAPMVMAWSKVRDLEETSVANALATLLALMF